MLFLADESCDAAIVRALRGAGHDVKAISEMLLGATDQAILDLAAAERRVLITKDKDFGELVFTGSTWAPVILLRFPRFAANSFPRTGITAPRRPRKKSTGFFIGAPLLGLRPAYRVLSAKISGLLLYIALAGTLLGVMASGFGWI